MIGNWIAVVIMLFIIILDIWCHRANIVRMIENRENPADLQEGLQKDIAKLKQKRQAKLEKNKEKREKIKEKYEKKIALKNEKVNKKLEKINPKEEKTDRAKKDISTKK